MRRLLTLLVFCTTMLHATPPKLTIVCIVDQMAQHLYSRHTPFFTGGFKQFNTNGYSYTNAYYPHGLPGTAPGHTAIATGTTAHEHGIIANSWFEGDKKVKACDSSTKGNEVLCPEGVYTKKKSAESLHAQTLSCVFNAAGGRTIALALKSRASIPLSGPDGLPIWFDSRTGLFTTSKAFVPQLPPFVSAINTHLRSTLHTQTHTQWQTKFPMESAAYQFTHDGPYRYTGNPFCLVGESQPYDRTSRKPYHLFEMTPAAGLELLRMAKLATKQHFTHNPDQPLLLYVSMSNLDYIGHYYGPYSMEAVDLLYHTDQQLGEFISYMEHEYGADNCLWVLSADHGVMPIPERLQLKGRDQAQRLDAPLIQKDLNRAIYKNFNVKNLIKSIDVPNIYFNHDKWDHLDVEKQKLINNFVTSFLEAVHGIKHAWTGTELRDRANFTNRYGAHSRERWFAQQYYPDRSGNIIVHIDEYTYINEFSSGASHQSPYDYDVRVPLIFYGPGRISTGTNHTRVPMTRFATSLAQKMEVSRPAHASALPLPGMH